MNPNPFFNQIPVKPHEEDAPNPSQRLTNAENSILYMAKEMDKHTLEMRRLRRSFGFFLLGMIVYTLIRVFI